MTLRDAIAQGQRKYGGKFDPSNLVPHFAPYFESGERIEVTRGDYVRRGTVGKTTGWKPCFLLMARRSDHGSSDCLNAADYVSARIDKRGKRHPTT